MNTAHPDIIVVSPDGEYLIVVKVKLTNGNHLQDVDALEQLKSVMASFGCSNGLLVTGNFIFILRDSFEKSHGESIYLVGKAKLPEFLLPSVGEQWQQERAMEFELRVQQWLEHLKQPSSLQMLPKDLRTLLEGHIINRLRFGDIRAARLREVRVVS
ncbi:hypothetical protein RIF25_03930 [Thermosynechococcaceae cyanobacterium BACA0444]|uniref:Uncharacterized protein n=1 Tax=Pseudocalidococcus azoricus BACA0444 TaxID=2918990 RepID=A0AAE4FRJ2_9CYAN|nr:hypothetical protein [Pseudocalidococcus azoricus]MDS3859952.1 hypothetical protein [Pseudocalidococcus azoricus BACA0444]